MPTNVVDGLAGEVVAGDGPHIMRLSCVATGTMSPGDAVKYTAQHTVQRCNAQADEVLGYAERDAEKGTTDFATGDRVSVIKLGSNCVIMANAGATVTRGKVAILHTSPHLVQDAGALPLAVRSAGVFVASRTGAGIVQLNPAGHP